jgi:hypothetical protein
MKKLTVIFIIIISFVLYTVYYRKKPQIEQKITQTFQTIEDVRTTIAPQPTVIQSDGLPDFHLIKTSFVPQAPEKIWDQPWQDACEESALLTVIYNYNAKTPSISDIVVDVNEMIDYEKRVGWTHDVNLTQMGIIAKETYGLNSTIIDSPTIEDIKKNIADNLPVIVPANGKTLFKENTHFKSGGPWYHNIVILGYDDPKKQFIVHDVGTQYGAYFRYSYRLLMESIHDFPDTGKKEDIDLGAKSVLVLLK